MKTAEEILKSWHQDFDQEFEVELKKDTVILAMQEYAEEYYRERLREKPKPYSCRSCRHWTVIDALGGEYCKVLRKSVASPRDDFKHKDCPLI